MLDFFHFSVLTRLGYLPVYLTKMLNALIGKLILANIKLTHDYSLMSTLFLFCSVIYRAINNHSYYGLKDPLSYFFLIFALVITIIIVNCLAWFTYPCYVISVITKVELHVFLKHYSCIKEQKQW